MTSHPSPNAGLPTAVLTTRSRKCIHGGRWKFYIYTDKRGWVTHSHAAEASSISYTSTA